MIPYARLTPGPGFNPGRALAYYSQRLVTAPPARRVVSGAIAAAVRLRRPFAHVWPLSGRARMALSELRREGVALIDPLLSRGQADAMVRYFKDQPLVTLGGEPIRREDPPPGLATAGYTLDAVLRCPGLVELVNRPPLLATVADYLGCKPTISSIGVRWTFPDAAGGARFQDFHRDVDDWRFLKLFIYLTDVDAESGPHEYVRRSHLAGFPLTSERHTPEGLAERFGSDALVSIEGARGTSFLADTLGVHRARRPLRRPRLMLQVQYSLLPVFAFRYARPSVEADGVDAYCNRLLVKRAAAPLRAAA